jgi:hypothetical protein
MDPNRNQPLKEVHFGVDFVFCQISGFLIGLFTGLAIQPVNSREFHLENLIAYCTSAAFTAAWGGILGSVWGVYRARKQASRKSANDSRRSA